MTYEEIKANYPVGKVLHEIVDVIKHQLVYYNSTDLKCYMKKYDKVEITSSITCDCWETVKSQVRVSGWLYDGKDWMPAYETWDGWIPYTKEELEKYK